jgi:type VI protein secretion system component Hcp
MRVTLMRGARLLVFAAALLGLAAGTAAAIGNKAGRPDRSLPGREPPGSSITVLRVTITPRSGSPVMFFARSYENLGLSTGSTGAHEYVPFVVSHGIDQSTSPRLAQLFATGEPLPTVQIDVLDATGALLFSYALTDAWVAVYRHVTQTAGVVEDVGFGFKTITYTFGTEVVTDNARISLDRINTSG